MRGDAACRLFEDQQDRSEEHTSELQSPCNLVCRLLLEKKKIIAALAFVSALAHFPDLTLRVRPVLELCFTMCRLPRPCRHTPCHRSFRFFFFFKSGGPPRGPTLFPRAPLSH